MKNVKRDLIEVLYSDYLENNGNDTIQERRASKISNEADIKLIAGTLTTEDLADYEGAARCAGFYAGFIAAVSILRAC